MIQKFGILEVVNHAVVKLATSYSRTESFIKNSVSTLIILQLNDIFRISQCHGKLALHTFKIPFFLHFPETLSKIYQKL